MDAKKTPKADLQNKRGLFLEIGLVFALLMCIIAFSLSQKERSFEQIELVTWEFQEEMVEVTRQEQTRPPEPQQAEQRTMNVITDIIQTVRNDAVITTTFDFVEFAEEMTFNIVAANLGIGTGVVAEAEVEEAIPFFTIEEPPTFQGSADLNTFRNWAQNLTKYPIIAQENGLQGMVHVTFVIERDGSLTNIQIMQTPDRTFSEEVIRVLNTSPRWTPGKQRGEPVRVAYQMPIQFILSMN